MVVRRKFPVLGVILILVGVAGLLWLSAVARLPWGRFGGPWGSGGLFPGPGMGPGMMGRWWSNWQGRQAFGSNGERIYYTGISQKDGYVPRAGGPPWAYQPGVGCVACHGVNGRGGVPVMMGTAIPADIRYDGLTGKVLEPGGEKTEHPPYTDATIKRAITQGVDPTGKPLDWTMPRWQMPEQDLNDVMAYLKTLR